MNRIVYHTTNTKKYTNSHVHVALQVAGALKNVLAIAAGICEAQPVGVISSEDWRSTNGFHVFSDRKVMESFESLDLLIVLKILNEIITGFMIAQ